jgi:hypothetical protein
MEIRRIMIATLLLSSIMACNSKTNDKLKNISQTEQIKQQLIEQIKIRTENHIKKYGIKKVLLDNGGKWFAGFGEYYVFLNNGQVNQKFKHIEKHFLWKANYRDLYFNLKGLDSNFDNNYYKL